MIKDKRNNKLKNLIVYIKNNLYLLLTFKIHIYRNFMSKIYDI